MQGRKHGEGKSKPETGLQSLGQGSWIRARNREGQAGSRCGVSKMRSKVCGGWDTRWKFRTSLGHGDMWIGVPVQCYTECNTLSLHFLSTIASFLHRIVSSVVWRNVYKDSVHPLVKQGKMYV